MSNIDDLIARKQEIMNDATLSPAEKKKQLRTLRKQIRKAGGSSQRKPKEPKAETSSVFKGTKKKTPALDITIEQLKSNIQEFCEKQELKFFDHKNTPGYAFSLKLCIDAGAVDPALMINKFRERWGIKPTEYSFITLGSHDILFLIGPVQKIGA